MAEINKVIVIPEGKIRDYVDGTIRNDTPEEYVRQTVEKRLVNEHKYPKEKIAVEYPIQMGSGRKRADIVAGTRHKQQVVIVGLFQCVSIGAFILIG